MSSNITVHLKPNPAPRLERDWTNLSAYCWSIQFCFPVCVSVSRQFTASQCGCTQTFTSINNQFNVCFFSFAVSISSISFAQCVVHIEISFIFYYACALFKVHFVTFPAYEYLLWFWDFWVFLSWKYSRFSSVSVDCIVCVCIIVRFFHDAGLLCWQQLRISRSSSKTTSGFLRWTSSGETTVFYLYSN